MTPFHALTNTNRHLLLPSFVDDSCLSLDVAQVLQLTNLESLVVLVRRMMYYCHYMMNYEWVYTRRDITVLTSIHHVHNQGTKTVHEMQ